MDVVFTCASPISSCGSDGPLAQGEKVLLNLKPRDGFPDTIKVEVTSVEPSFTEVTQQWVYTFSYDDDDVGSFQLDQCDISGVGCIPCNCADLDDRLTALEQNSGGNGCDCQTIDDRLAALEQQQGCDCQAIETQLNSLDDRLTTLENQGGGNCDCEALQIKIDQAEVDIQLLKDQLTLVMEALPYCVENLL